MYLRFITLLFLTLIPIMSSSQEAPGYGSIGGQVLDPAANPIDNVSVFMHNTTLGDASDSLGKYLITRVPTGHYTLVASMMGYEMQKKEVTIEDKKHTVLHLLLVPKAITFEPLEISASEAKEWKKHLGEFKKLFIGTSESALKCEITNPEVIDFSKPSRDLFNARAQAPIILINPEFGYRVEFILEYFTASGGELRYSVQTRFIEIEEEDEKQRKEWQTKRLKAYAGSIRHFLDALIVGETEQAGFWISSLVECPQWGRDNTRWPTRMLDSSVSIEPGSNDFERILSFSGCMQVEYSKESAESGYMHDDRQISWIELPHQIPVSVDIRGNILYGSVIKKYGYWAWKRAGDMLPTDYVPPVH